MDYGVINETDGNAPQTERIVVGSTTRDLTTATSTQAIAGLGFKPSYVQLFGTIDGAEAGGWGVSDGTNEKTFGQAVASSFANSSGALYAIVDGSNLQTAKVQSFDVSGFTLSWVKSGTPTGTMQVYYTAFK